MKLKRVLPIAISVVLMLGFSACNKKGQISGSGDFSGVVATVAGEDITALELKFYTSMDKLQAENDAGLSDKSEEEKEEYWGSEEGKAKGQEIIDKTFENVKELKLLLLSANKANVKLEQEDLDKINESIDQLIQSEGDGDKAKTDEFLMKDYGVTLDQYQEMFEELYLAYNKYVQVGPTKIEISDSEVQKEFESNKEAYDKVKVKHILLKTIDDSKQPLPEDKIAEKKTLAEDVLQKVKDGEDFGEMVKEYSEDPGSISTGGEYTFGKGEMVAEFEDWSFNAKEGDVGIVETSYGFHVMKFIENVPASLGDEEKSEITTSLQNAQFNKMIDDLKADNQLEKNQEVIDSLDLF